MVARHRSRPILVLTSVVDPEGNITTYQYSDRDLLTRQDWLDGSSVEAVTTYRYNDHGEQTSETDARNVTVIRVVDAADRVTKADYPGTALDVDYVYGTVLPDIGRLQSVTRNGLAVSYDYDVFGRTTQDGDLAFTLDKNSNVLTITYPGAVTATYGYDGADREKSLQIATPGTTDPQLVSSAAYLPSGPVEVLTLGNGLTERHEFDDRYLPDKIRLLAGATPLLDWDYATDPIGNLTIIDDLLPSAQDRSFDYQDHQYFVTCSAGPWLATASTCQPGQTGEPTLWTYDEIGNRLSEIHNTTEPPPLHTPKRRGDGTGADEYTYLPNPAAGNTPILDQVEIAPGGTRVYTFGPAGHLEELFASSNVVEVVNDAAGQVGTFRRSGGQVPSVADISYDGRGFLREVTSTIEPIFQDGFETGDVSCWDASVTFASGFSRNDGTCQPPTTEGPSVEALYDSRGLLHRIVSTTVETGATSKYVFYLAGRPVGQLTVDDLGNETWWLLATDHLGVPVLASTLAGATVWQGMFEPFGESFGDVQTHLRLPGQWVDVSWTDASSGLNPSYNVHRWYEHGTGRYTRPDPLLDGSNQPALQQSPKAAVALAGEPTWGLYRQLNPLFPHAYTYAGSRVTFQLDLNGREVVILGRTPGILRPGPWRLPPGQTFRVCKPIRPTPVSPRPVPEPPPLLPRPNPSPPWWWLPLDSLIDNLGGPPDPAPGLPLIIPPSFLTPSTPAGPECPCETDPLQPPWA